MVHGVQGTRQSVDVLIVGSGPVGAAFARVIHETAPRMSILMVEAGPQLTERPGMNMRNVPGGHQYAKDIDFVGDVDKVTRRPMARSGTYLYADDNPDSAPSSMPAAAYSMSVGGMGAFWGTACPRPYGAERIAFLEGELDELLKTGESLLAAQQAYLDSARVNVSLAVLEEALAPRVAGHRPVQALPTGTQQQPDGKLYWTGSDVVLGPLVSPGKAARFELRSRTLCRRLIVDQDHVAGANLVDPQSGTSYEVHAGAVVVAADGVRTAQVLHASGIRRTALGHYFNEHPLAMCIVALHKELREQIRELSGGGSQPAGAARIWVPYNDDLHPHNGTISDLGPFQLPSTADPELSAEDAAVLHWAGLGEPHEQNWIEFLDDRQDRYGMPGIRFHYSRDLFDQECLQDGVTAMCKAAEALGTIVPGREPVLLPNGSSLHYQGAARMGAVDDGTSVCDPNSRVWGFRNLYIGGNCVIPTATACNPTLTSVALAVKAARHLVSN
jgi:choline dehydrogenase-like flavoprotein